MVTLTHEEAQSYLAYALICETMEGAFWNSGRRRRLYSKTFTEAEQRQIPRIKAIAHKWCLVTGVPEKVRMRFWQCVCDHRRFCESAQGNSFRAVFH